MFAEMQDLGILLEIQQIDLETMQAKKKRAELPQRIEVMRLLKKRDEVQAKLDEVLELERKVQAEVTIVEDEDRSLAEKQERAQELIDAAGSDYRKVESHSKEMAGVAKRRETLSEKSLGLSEQMAKVQAARAQLEGALAAATAKEAELRASFEGEDCELVQRVAALTARREELAPQVPADLLALYNRTAKRTGGVAIGRMVDEACGVCRTAIDPGRVIELRASAPLGTCPNCKRLLVVE